MALLSLALAAACTSDPDSGASNTEGSTGPSETETTSGSTSMGSTSMGSTSMGSTSGEPGMLNCGQHTDRAACEAGGSDTETFCQWFSYPAVTYADGACEAGEPIETCFETASGGEDGCGATLGCNGFAQVLEADGRIAVYDSCGGPPSPSTGACEFISPGVYDPPECACICDLPVDIPGGSTGGDTDGDTDTDG